jgi:hypothetical protein
MPDSDSADQMTDRGCHRVHLTDIRQRARWATTEA